MSYNPAFVCDESPLACSAAHSHDHSNGGIKLTSFKPLANTNGDSIGATPTSHAEGRADPQKQQRTNSLRAGHKQEGGGAAAAAHHKTSGLTGPSKVGLGTGCQPPVGNYFVSNSSSMSLIGDHSATSGSPMTLNSLATSATMNSQPTSNYSQSESSVSMLSTGLCAAVECRDMRYTVGRGKNQKNILHDINVTVPEGSIYGLLGPSGCGKTTMLRCVVGRIKPKSGFVRVFGYAPNESGSQIPGPAIGYMPQVSVTSSPSFPFRSLLFVALPQKTP